MAVRWLIFSLCQSFSFPLLNNTEMVSSYQNSANLKSGRLNGKLYHSYPDRIREPGLLTQKWSLCVKY
jgi:hypothetical protein